MDFYKAIHLEDLKPKNGKYDLQMQEEFANSAIACLKTCSSNNNSTTFKIISSIKDVLSLCCSWINVLPEEIGLSLVTLLHKHVIRNDAIPHDMAVSIFKKKFIIYLTTASYGTDISEDSAFAVASHKFLIDFLTWKGYDNMDDDSTATEQITTLQKAVLSMFKFCCHSKKYREVASLLMAENWKYFETEILPQFQELKFTEQHFGFFEFLAEVMDKYDPLLKLKLNLERQEAKYISLMPVQLIHFKNSFEAVYKKAFDFNYSDLKTNFSCHALLLYFSAWMNKTKKACELIDNFKCDSELQKDVNKKQKKILLNSWQGVTFIKCISKISIPLMDLINRYGIPKWYLTKFNESQVYFVSEIINFMKIYGDVFGLHNLCIHFEPRLLLDMFLESQPILINYDSASYFKAVKDLFEILLKTREERFAVANFSLDCEKDVEFLKKIVTFYGSNVNDDFGFESKQLCLHYINTILTELGLVLHTYNYIDLWLNNLQPEKIEEQVTFFVNVILIAVLELPNNLKFFYTDKNNSDLKTDFLILAGLIEIDLINFKKYPDQYMYFTRIVCNYTLCTKNSNFFNENCKFVKGFKKNLKPFEFIENSFDQNTSMVSLVSRFISYLKSNQIGSNITENDNKIMLEGFNTTVKNLQKLSPEKSGSVDVFKFILKHEFVLKFYNPFLEDESINVNTIVEIVLNDYPSLHKELKPFFEVILMQLQDIFKTENDYTKNIEILSIFIEKYENLTYRDLETLIIEFSSNEIFNDLLTKALVQVQIFKVSDNLTGILVRKLRSLLKKTDLTQKEKNLEKTLQEILSKSSLDLNLYKKIKKGNFSFDSELKAVILFWNVLFVKHEETAERKTKKPRKFEKRNSMVLNCDLTLQFLTNNKIAIWEWALTQNNASETFFSVLNYMLKAKIYDVSELPTLLSTITSKIKSSDLQSAFISITLIPSLIETIKLSKQLLSFDKLLSTLFKFVYKNFEVTEKKMLFENLNKAITIIANTVQKETLKNHIKWKKFALQVLKISLTEEGNVEMLQCLTSLIPLVYSEEDKKEETVEGLSAKELHDMTWSHSQFTTIMSGKKNDALKEAVVRLLLSLVEVDGHLCLELRAPVLREAYGATQANVDTAIFKLLSVYNDFDKLGTDKLMLWGPVALFNEEEEGQERTKMTKLLLQEAMVLRTALHFDVKLSCEASLIAVPTSWCYDQRLLLIVFQQLIREVSHWENIKWLCEKGAAVIALAALSSELSNVRLRGAAILKGIADVWKKLPPSESRMAYLWLSIEMCSMLQRNNNERPIPTLLIHTVIRAERQLALEKTAKENWAPLKQLFAQPDLCDNKLPLRNTLLWSKERPISHLQLLLRLLSKGITNNIDYDICKNQFITHFIIQILCDYRNLYHEDTILLLMGVLQSMAKTMTGAKDLIVTHNLLSILPLYCIWDKGHKAESKRAILRAVSIMKVLETLWNTWLYPHKAIIQQRPEPTTQEPSGKAQRKRKANNLILINEISPFGYQLLHCLQRVGSFVVRNAALEDASKTTLFMADVVSCMKKELAMDEDAKNWINKQVNICIQDCSLDSRFNSLNYQSNSNIALRVPT